MEVLCFSHCLKRIYFVVTIVFCFPHRSVSNASVVEEPYVSSTVCVKRNIFIPPVRNYVCLFVCLCVCFFVCKLFSVKDFSATTWLRALKFGTQLDSDELYCVTKNIVQQKNSHILLISPFICSFFFLSNGNFCHRFLSAYWSQCFQILCTPSGRQSVLCKWKLSC